MPGLKVYYNSACPVCDAGIKDQRDRMQGCQAEWLDIHNNPDVLREIGAEREFVRERLHVMDESGQVYVGADAFTLLWSRTRSQRWLAALSRLPLLRTLSRWAYNAFARLLYRWNRRHGRW